MIVALLPFNFDDFKIEKNKHKYIFTKKEHLKRKKKGVGRKLTILMDAS